VGRIKVLANTVSAGGPLDDGAPADFQEFDAAVLIVGVVLWSVRVIFEVIYG